MSKLTREEMDRIISEHFQYEAQDVDGVVSTLTEDMEHDIVGSPGSQVTGREAARKYYQGLFPNLKGESVQPVFERELEHQRYRSESRPASAPPPGCREQASRAVGGGSGRRTGQAAGS